MCHDCFQVRIVHQGQSRPKGHRYCGQGVRGWYLWNVSRLGQWGQWCVSNSKPGRSRTWTQVRRFCSRKNSDKELWLCQTEHVCVEGMPHLAICGMHLLLACLFCGWVLSSVFNDCSCLMAPSVGMVGHLLTLWWNQHLRKNENVLDKPCLEYPVVSHSILHLDLSPTQAVCLDTLANKELIFPMAVKNPAVFADKLMNEPTGASTPLVWLLVYSYSRRRKDYGLTLRPACSAQQESQANLSLQESVGCSCKEDTSAMHIASIWKVHRFLQKKPFNCFCDRQQCAM